MACKEIQMELLKYALVTGVIATAVTDLWAWIRAPLLGVPRPDYGLVGRWFVGFVHGRFRHDSIASSPPARFERAIGWSAHYLIGIAFASALLWIVGLHWIEAPTLAPALALGIGTVVAPFLVMQPGMGAGVAASRTRNPNAARLQSLITHAVFGAGLYVAGQIASLI
jgi:DUF2938 family protein